MPIFEAFALAAPELLGTEAALTGAEALTAAELGTAALTAGELAGLGVAAGETAAIAPGITQAALEANAAAGGAGAGAANINAAQVGAQQAAAQGINAIPQIAPQTPMGLEMPGAYTPPANYPMGINAQIPAEQFIEAGSGVPYTAENAMAQANLTANATPPSALEAGMDKAIKFAEKNPFTAMTAAYMGANALGLLNPSGATFNNAPYSGPLSKYFLSPNFQGRTANPADFQYKPRYAGGGGIMGADPYSIPVGYGDGGDVPSYAEGDLVAPPALPMPSRTMRSSDAFQVPGQPQDPSQFAAADAYNDILRNRVIADTSTNRLNDYNRGYYQATPNELTQMADNTKFGFSSGMAQKELASRSNEGEFAVPGYGDLGQFAGGGNDNYASRFAGSASFNQLKDDNPYNVDAFAKGGSLSDSISEYQRMLSGNTPAAPAASHDVGIYYDQDPDTRYQDALTAAQIRQAKVNQRAYVSAPVAKRPTPMGKLNLPTSAKSKDSSGGDVEAYRGGIMHSSLGGYAAGGNPRLLKGPGDGMSDNIPATINGRQPARLADGEFVIPADVVSHLGNGSTEAGAKQLHGMMDKVRKARTGNPKQGKEINPQKYMPK